MHFDVITDKKDDRKAIEYAKEWLKIVGEYDSKVTTEECRFCHSQNVPDEIEIEIMTSGYFISKMEGCPYQPNLTKQPQKLLMNLQENFLK